MGATVTTAKHIAAIRTESGKILYILREQTYEKNCYPHTPKWSCVHIGYLADVYEAIFRFGSACEGGMLQNRSGHITPEGYIAGWLKLLEAPVEQTDIVVEFRTGSGFYYTIQPGQVDQALRVLENLERSDLMQCVRNEQSFLLSLECDADLIIALYKGAGLSPWRIIQSGNPPMGCTNPALGYAPVATKIGVFEPPAFVRIDDHVRLMRHADDSWTCEGWAYSIVGHYIAQYSGIELAEPSSYKKRIKAFREAVNSAPLMREGVALKVYTNRTSPSGDDERQAKKLAHIQREFPCTVTSDGLVIQLTAEMDIYGLTYLPQHLVEWSVTQDEDPATRPQQTEMFADAA